MTIRPYKNIDNKIDGAILTVFDIDAARQHELEAQAARDYAEAVIGAVRYPLMILDSNFHIQTANQAFSKLFQFKGPIRRGTPLREVGDGPWNDPRLRTMLDQVLPGDGNVTNMRVPYTSELGRQETIQFTARKVLGTNRRPSYILLEMEKVTEDPSVLHSP
jgi:two-component system, chemotaxis family, CheB/CheR fusion protein